MKEYLFGNQTFSIIPHQFLKMKKLYPHNGFLKEIKSNFKVVKKT